MRQIFWQRSGGYRSKARIGGLVAVAVIFSVTGVRLLSASQAEPLTPATTSLSLAPANVVVKQGDLINIAVNMTVGDGDSAGDVKAVVTYPADQLELQSVQQACPLPSFTGGGSQTPKAGVVNINCTSVSGVVATQMLATMVFKALADTGGAPITVDNGASTVVSHRSNKQRILQSTSGATMNLEARKSRSATPRPTHTINSKPVCATRVAGYARCHAYKGTELDGRPLNSNDAASIGFGPQEYHMGYQMPCTPGGPVAAICATPSTYGPETIAIVDAGGYTGGPSQLESDVQTVNQKYGMAACTIASGCLTVVNQQGATSPMPKDAGWSDEINMDVVAAHEMCQTCKIVLVLSNDAGSSMDVAQAYAASLKPIAISDSWSGGSDSTAAFNHPEIAQLIATGDDGILPTGEVNNPVDFTTVLAVSGTDLRVNTDGSWASEQLWNLSGGGCSPTVAAPSWQTSIANWPSVGCGTKRAYGDIVAAGGDISGMASYMGGRWDSYSGTSLSAPLLAGMIAVSNPGGAPSSVQWPQFIYSTFNSTNSHDISTGNNCTSRTTTHCTAGVGYDVPTGMGAPYGTAGLRVSTATTPPPATPPPTTPPPTTPPTTPPPTTPPTTPTKKGDLNGDNKVNVADLSKMLSNWNSALASCDLNGNGRVDVADLSILLSNWTG